LDAGSAGAGGASEPHRKSCVGYQAPGNGSARPTRKIEISMANREQRRIVETPTRVRQAEPGPSVLALLLASTGLAVLILGVLWFVFFRS
jgi:hypothetical protein